MASDVLGGTVDDKVSPPLERTAQHGRQPRGGHGGQGADEVEGGNEVPEGGGSRENADGQDFRLGGQPPPDADL